MLDEPRTATFSMSIDPKKKEEMENFFENLGLSLTAGVNVFFEASVIQGTIPFELKRQAVDLSALDIEKEQPAQPKKSVRFSMRIMPTRKRQMEYICEQLGMTLSQAVHMYFAACWEEYGIPFRIGYPKPNAETLAAMQEENLEAYGSFEEYLAAMHSLADGE